MRTPFIAGAMLALTTVPASATLVVMVPSNAGLIVAADSRTTARGADGAPVYCDQQFKILEPVGFDRTVVVVTGNVPELVEVPTAALASSDPTILCKHLRDDGRSFDITAAVLDFLRRSGASSILALDMKALAGRCAQEIRQAQTRRASAFEQFRNQEIFRVGLATYDPSTRISALRSFVMAISSQLEPIPVRADERRIGPTDTRDYWAAGETGYLDKEVLGGFGRLFFSMTTRRFLQGNKPVSDITAKEAEDVAINLIDATSKATAVVLAPSGIGGPVDAVLLGTDPRPLHLRWKP